MTNGIPVPPIVDCRDFAGISPDRLGPVRHLRPRASPVCLTLTTTYERPNAFGRQGPTQSRRRNNRLSRRTVSTVRILSPRPSSIKKRPSHLLGLFLFGLGRELEPNQRFSDSRSESRRALARPSNARVRAEGPNPILSPRPVFSTS